MKELIKEFMGWFADSSHFLSLVAIIVSVLAWITSWRTQARLVTIEEARETDRLKRSRRAKIRAELVREPTGTSMGDFLRVYNDGDTEARDVRIRLSGDRPVSSPQSETGQKENLLAE